MRPTPCFMPHPQFALMLVAPALPLNDVLLTPKETDGLTAIDAAALEAAASKDEKDSYDDFRAALAGGRTWLNLRLRLEHVDQEGFTRDAFANTLRTALGYETGVYEGFQAYLEVEDVAPIGEDDYNSTTNGETDRPVIADPNGTEFNQAYLQYTGFEDLILRAGRQEVAFDNHRFIGTVPWRQNYQSHDAIAAVYQGIENTSVTYGFVHDINRIFGENNPAGRLETNSHLLNIGHDLENIGKLTGYFYYLDIDKVQSLSTSTVGLRLTGKQDVNEDVDILYTGEYAKQDDIADNPINVDQDYYLAEVGVQASGFTVKLANEHLGGSVGDGAFSTPLATLHAFNGFADVFLNTPPTGLEDRYLSVAKDFAGVKAMARYHMFESDSANIDYGTELDLNLLYPLNDHMTVGVRYANFDADREGGFSDVEKVMAWVTYRVL